ncbi:serine hydrolase domain-containing protein [Streptomyces zagrosensis]|uniref:D-alanyl-D-alanine carboxypeptidase n=1 Tax=Streptomyces zagrosensis TaxID=1042984 RepID=A0A7W9QGA5_9ACTN|nr:serine hydrolase domain-containing protein [Streptomyces zagrosensis]MBB5939713.1 D-alanyl-D-alanine carboxypeptidase [Streptomyces zagrosensis]
MSGEQPVFSRRTGMTAAAAALLVGASPAVATADSTSRRGGLFRADQAGRDEGLQRDVDAIRATGATGVLAEIQTAHGRAAARAGGADQGARRPVPWDAYYRIGSDTKTFTATVALQLVGEGRLALTDTVDHWLPGLVRGNGNDGRRITVANVLRQTSGLNDYFSASDTGDVFTPDGYRKGRFTSQSPREQVAAALKQPPRWLPDADDPVSEQRWGYANTNYVLVGLLIERVTGHSWAQEVHERIIEPLGLRHTLIPGTSPYVPQPTATAYTAFPGTTDLTDTTLAYAGFADGALISTPRDLATFLRALFSGRLLSPAQLAAMQVTVAAEGWIAAAGVRYGLGIAWRPMRGDFGGIWFHGGTHLGVVSESGVRADGSRAATTAIFTLRMEGGQKDAQEKAALRLVDNALRTGAAPD